jgi:hypothetical protein
VITSHSQPISDHDIRAAVGWMRVDYPGLRHPRPVYPPRDASPQDRLTEPSPHRADDPAQGTKGDGMEGDAKVIDCAISALPPELTAVNQY